MYYVRPDMLVCIDDLSALKNDGHTDFDNIFATLVYKPRLEELFSATSPYLVELVTMSDGTWFAYSNVAESVEVMKETGRNDPFVRARGDTPWHALANLFIDVSNRYKRTSLSPEELIGSSNKVTGNPDPVIPQS